MNSTEAIEILENGEWWDALPEAKTIESYNGEMALHAAVDTAIAALREKAEQKNTGAWIWRNGKHCCSVCEQEPYRKNDNEMPFYCPNCGADMRGPE